MTDVHCHVRGGNAAVRELVVGEHFLGVHPWESGKAGGDTVGELRRRLVAEPGVGVGEIGLDRLKAREISPEMRALFESQLRLGVELGRPIALHGAKCWGQVVAAVRAAIAAADASPGRSDPGADAPSRGGGARFLFHGFSHGGDGARFLFHGFSRSDGLIPEIAALGGFVSVGPAVLNDHAVNYRELVRKIPDECLVLETDRTESNAAECPDVFRIASRVAELRGRTVAEIEALTDANASRFFAVGTLFRAASLSR